ncbi:MAG: type II toxin-antitoxin system RelE/ParE family toxin [Gammaproteobacteria bacterium]|nr:type II toxin-antitoxin system RelE/ParE family toxin [Gammaproteobacteria bacterium]MCP5125643.1 type II toxin-antitoxin system RelE/ParE family toxin [Gammaproteobacteria bacterium]
MEIEYEDISLHRLETDASFDKGLAHSIVRKFRMRIQFIRAAIDERAFYAMKSLHFEKLIGDRSNQYSMRLNDQWRLIIKFKKTASKTVVVIVEILDYH